MTQSMKFFLAVEKIDEDVSSPDPSLLDPPLCDIPRCSISPDAISRQVRYADIPIGRLRYTGST